MAVSKPGDPKPDLPGIARDEQTENWPRAPKVRYFVKEADILYRSTTGDILPDEVLWASGWRPVIGSATISADAYPRPSRRGTVGGGADPIMLTQLDEVDVDEAREIARRRGDLPTSGW